MSHKSRTRTAIALTAAVLTVVSTTQVVAAAPRPAPQPKPSHLRSIPGAPERVARSAWTQPRSVSPKHAAYPARAHYDLHLTNGKPVPLGRSGLNITAVGSGAAQVGVDVLDQASTRNLGLSGITVRVTRATKGTGPVSISASRALLNGLYGGDYAAHVRWTALPDCAAAARCARPKPLTTTAGKVDPTATTQLYGGKAVLLTAASTPGGSDGSGTFGATSLSSSSQWSTSPQTGDFSWNYPLRTPPPAGGKAPALALSYESGSIDGQTGTTNNQTSEIGSGWDLSGAGYIERSYAPCSLNGPAESGDTCWNGDNVTVSFTGHSGELVKDAASGAWRLAEDDNTRVEHLANNALLCANGTDDNDCWRLTTADGTQYYFGRNHLPGWTSSSQNTNSTWTEPVCGNASTACTGALGSMTPFATQAWRWNLDYVVDPHGNSTAYYYSTESNRYGENGSTTASASYVRGGILKRVDYGMHAGAELTATAPDQIVVTAANRCLPNTTCNASTLDADWPDVPGWANCADPTCGTNTATTFWSTKRLSSITTQYWNGSDYVPVDAWTLAQSWPDPHDGTDPSMQLDKISHAGKVGGTLAVPDTTFTYQMLQDRLVVNTGIVPLMKPRLQQVNLDSGGQLHITYLTPDCSTSSPPTPETNTKRCYPQYWSPPGMSKRLDWFNKYVVSQVVADPVYGRSWTDPGLNADTTTYDYSIGTPAWRFDTSPMTQDKSRTWSVFAGYTKVRVEHGDTATPGTLQTTDYTYLQGLDGDLKDASGAKRAVTVTATNSTHVTDSAQWAGETFETQTYNGKGGAVVTDNVTTPYTSNATATAAGVTEHIGTSSTTFTYIPIARHTGTADVTHRTALLAGGWRITDAITTHDTYGRVTKVDDRGDTSITPDDRCTTTAYADNTSTLRLSYPAEVKIVGVNCAATPSYPRDAISDVRASYDNQAPGTAPTVGDVTRAESVKGYDSSGQPIWLTTATTVFDALGRPTTVTDVLNRTASTVYTPAAPLAGGTPSGNVGPTTQTVTTNATGWLTTTLGNPAWGTPTSQTDPNGHTTTTSYDPLGRRTSVWGPDRQPAVSFPTPTASFIYADPSSNGSPTGPVSVATTTLTPSGGIKTSYAIYDGLLRPRQTQTPAEGTTAASEFTAPGSNGTLVADTLYTDAGQTSIANDPYYNSAAPSGTLWVPTHGEADVPTQTQTVYDGAGRTTTVIAEALGVELWRTSSAYGGDHVDVTPPAGGTPTTTYSDARGSTTKLLEYHAATPTGAADTTSYSYDSAGRPTGMTDASGQNSWNWTYDVLGRQISATDPDTGTTATTYDDAGRVTSTTDARHITLAYSYDTLDRKTAQYQDSASGPLLASWTYDTMGDGTTARGNLASSTSYVGSTPGTPGTAYTQNITGYDLADRPMGTSYVIPSVPGHESLAGTYTTTLVYNADGSLSQQKDPAMGGLPAETLKTFYTSLGNFWSYGGQSSYVYNTYYDQLGRITKLRQFNSAHELDSTYVYNAATNRLTSDTITTSATSNNVPAAATYTYDNAGDLTSIATTASATPTDTQCFNYDYLQRLTQAWTPASGGCSQTPTAANLGGPAAYWQDNGYDTTGNRTNLTTHTATTTKTDTYSYPAPGANQPHTLQTVTHSAGGTDTYHYDPDGNTTAAPGEALTWNATGQIESVTTTGKTQNRIYDTSGALLQQSDPVNGTVLYLGDTELRLSADDASVSGQRIYTAARHAVGSRTATAGTTGSTITWLATDAQGTATVEYNPTAGTPTVRRFDPFGNTRGTTITWTNDRGYLNAPTDPLTNTTQLGARTYQPALGRFLSVDPLLDLADPQSINGYAYSDNNPTTKTDPSGLKLADCSPGDCGAGPINGDTQNGSHPSRSSGDSGSSGSSGGSSDSADSSDSQAQATFLARYTAVQTNMRQQLAAYVRAKYEGLNPIPSPQLEQWMHYMSQCGGDIGYCYVAFQIALGKHLTASQAHDMERSICDSTGDVRTYCHTRYIAMLGEARPDSIGQMVQDTIVTLGVGGVLKALTARAIEEAGLAGRAATACGGGSFTPDTNVVMADRSTKPLDQVKVGDKVEATDTKTGKTTAQTVAKVWVNHDSDLMNVTITGGGKTSVIHATQHHLLWDVSRNAWVEAGRLAGGDWLRADNGALATVTDTALIPGTADMWDLTVNNDHDFYVVTTTANILVHNNCGVDFRSNTAHVFRDAVGHLSDDTPANRALIRGAVDPANLRSTITLNDGSTLAKYFQTLSNGTQAWAEVRNGSEITNGGLNVIPR